MIAPRNPHVKRITTKELEETLERYGCKKGPCRKSYCRWTTPKGFDFTVPNPATVPEVPDSELDHIFGIVLDDDKMGPPPGIENYPDSEDG